MEITFHGAARTVTGSQHLIQVNGYNLLLDCGLFQGRRAEYYERNRNFAFDPRDLDVVILSHAHIDHSGNLPNLVKSGFRGDIFCTHATAHLAEYMLMDSGFIQEKDAEYLNKKLARRGEPLVEPLYTQEDAAQVAGLMVGMDYDAPFEVVPGVTARLLDAGHILGSAAILLDIDDGRRARTRFCFSGDIGRRYLPILRDPVLPEDVDILLMECTYGDKAHRDPRLAHEELREVVKETVARGGKIIVPAFAVGRTQEIVYSLQMMINEGTIPRVPVFVDSPLAVNVSQVFREHPECYDEEALALVEENMGKGILGFDLLTYVRSVEESKALNFHEGPAVIISASGMAETGRILHHLKNNIGDERNTILIVSWQAPHTLGRRLADREEKVKIFGEVYRRKAQVATIGGFSAHAGQDGLVKYAQTAQAREIFLVHGEPDAAGAFQARLAAEGIEKVSYPAWGDRATF